MATALRPGAILGVLKEARTALREDKPIQVEGVLAEQLARELRAGGDERWVRVGGRPARAAAVVLVLAGAPKPEDEELLRAARKARTPVVAVQTAQGDPIDVPYVLATDVVPCPPGAGFPVDEIGRVLASRLGEAATALAAHLPTLRPAVVEQLVQRFSRQNGVIGAAIFVPGADLPVLTLNQLRLVLRLAAAHGVEIDNRRVPEVLAVVGNGFALRALARQLLGVIPVAGWAVKGGVAYGGTRAVGEAAKRYFERLTQASQAS